MRIVTCTLQRVRRRLYCGFVPHVFYTAFMHTFISIYKTGSSPVHSCDARVKIVLLIAYVATLFLVDTWVGMVCAHLALALIVAVSGIGIKPFAAPLVTTAVLMVLTIVFNGVSYNVYAALVDAPRLGIASFDAALASWIEQTGEPVLVLVDSFGITGTGMARGAFYALRIFALVLASLVVTYTTTSTALTNAFRDFLSPLGYIRLPVDDIAMVFSIALRFIPVTFEEFWRIRDAQWARCAPFDTGSLFERMRTWSAVFIPLFVRLFRRADALAQAMDARCYGMPEVRRTSLVEQKLDACSVITAVVGLGVCVLVAATL